VVVSHSFTSQPTHMSHHQPIHVSHRTDAKWLLLGLPHGTSAHKIVGFPQPSKYHNFLIWGSFDTKQATLESYG
jgi:hypothetical protein